MDKSWQHFFLIDFVGSRRLIVFDTRSAGFPLFEEGVDMLTRYPGTRATGSCLRDVLRILNYSQGGSRHFRCGTASFIARKQNDKTSVRSILAPAGTSCAYARSSFVPQFERWQARKRLYSTETGGDAPQNSKRKDDIYALIDTVNQGDTELAAMLHDLDLLDRPDKADAVDGSEMDAVSETTGHREVETLESRVRTARQLFGETLPEGQLNDEEMRLYVQLYGEPIAQEPELADDEGIEEGLSEDVDGGQDILYREDGEGGWEEVEFEEAEQHEEEPEIVYDMEAGPPIEETSAMQRTREVAEQLGGEVMLEEFGDQANADPGQRLHPLTLQGKFSTDSKTVFMPKDSLTIPVSAILSNFSNKHISEVAHRTFGGRRLPNSTSNPPPFLQLPQSPIPLNASQRHMTEMEANTYFAVLYPGIYATSLSILAEVRKRLGSSWLRGLMSQEGGPNVLDASGGGAGILAWREVLRAEWEAMDPERPDTDPLNLGRSTVVAGSESLQSRASLMLENTTFLPRLPDYVHIREKPTLDDERAPTRKKQYDVIIAPHSLLGFEEDYMRKEHVENLWTLLNPNGGVLILFEKGRQRGFEAIAGARDMMLKRHIASPGSTEYENFTESPDDTTAVEKEPGMIVAPCTNHNKCPMYAGPWQSKGRRDYCHFGQRYIRPPFLQRIIGAKDRNHEDVQFSYVAVQRGVDLRQTEGIKQGDEATDTAFEGYDQDHDMEANGTLEQQAAATNDAKPFHPLALPRSVYPPMKRRGHVIFDFCTPAGKIERWTVPRSYSRQAYKDARKAHWGDLWALGAKTRIHRHLSLGSKDAESKKERLARRAAVREAMQEGDGEFDEESALERRMQEEEDDEDAKASAGDFADLPVPTRKKGQHIPSWKKHADKKTLRQAMKKRSVEKVMKEIGIE